MSLSVSHDSSVRAVDLSLGTELLPPYKVKSEEESVSCWLVSTHLLPPPLQVLILSLADLSAVTHLVVAASNLNGKQVTENELDFNPLLNT